jgi:hypothetical protein
VFPDALGIGGGLRPAASFYLGKVVPEPK